MLQCGRLRIVLDADPFGQPVELRKERRVHPRLLRGVAAHGLFVQSLGARQITAAQQCAKLTCRIVHGRCDDLFP